MKLKKLDLDNLNDKSLKNQFLDSNSLICKSVGLGAGFVFVITASLLANSDLIQNYSETEASFDFTSPEINNSVRKPLKIEVKESLRTKGIQFRDGIKKTQKKPSQKILKLKFSDQEFEKISKLPLLEFKKDPRLLGVVNSKGQNIFMHNLIMKDFNRAKELLRLKKLDIRHKDQNGSTALLYAIQNSADKDLIELIISRGADLNIIDNFERTVLSVASNLDRQNIFDQLIQRPLSHKVFKTSFYKEIFIQSKSSLVKYIRSEPRLLEEKISENQTALFIACKEGLVDTMDVLINMGADTSASNDQGQSIKEYAKNHNPRCYAYFSES